MNYTASTSERTVLIESRQYNTARYSDVDRVIAVSTIRGLSQFLQTNCLDTQNKTSYRNLRIGYISYSKCNTALQLIKTHPQVFPVDNVVNCWNRSKRTHRYYWERTLHYSDRKLLVHLDKEKVAILQEKKKGSVPIITIAKSACEAIAREQSSLCLSIPCIPRSNGLISCCTLY